MSLRPPGCLGGLVAQSAIRFGVGSYPPAPEGYHRVAYGRGEACGFLGPLRIVLVDIAKHAPLGQSDLIPPLAYAAMSQTREMEDDIWTDPGRHYKDDLLHTTDGIAVSTIAKYRKPNTPIVAAFA